MIPSLSNVDTKWFDAKCQSTRWFPNFWVGVRNGVGEKIALILKGLPPSHHLIGKSHSITNDDVTCEGCGVSNGIVEYHIENSEIEMGSWTPNCLLLDLVGCFNASQTFVYHHPERFLLILICEGSQIFVWRNNAFIFFKRVTSYFSTKPGSIETKPTLVVEVSNVNLQSI